MQKHPALAIVKEADIERSPERTLGNGVASAEVEALIVDRLDGEGD